MPNRILVWFDVSNVKYFPDILFSPHKLSSYFLSTRHWTNQRCGSIRPVTRWQWKLLVLDSSHVHLQWWVCSRGLSKQHLWIRWKWILWDFFSWSSNLWTWVMNQVFIMNTTMWELYHCLTEILCSLDAFPEGILSSDQQALLDETFPYGTMVTYTCHSGYLLVGSSTRTCTGDGSSSLGYFNGEQPQCQGAH